MSIRKNVRLHLNSVPNAALDGKFSGVNLRRDGLDNNAVYRANGSVN
jgi:hypothetical protein